MPPEFLADRSIGRRVVTQYRVPLFALSNANLGFADMAGAFLAAMRQIHAICEESDRGGIWVVHRDGRVESLWIPGRPDQ